MRLDPAGLPFIIGCAGSSASIAGAAIGGVFALPFVVLAAFFVFFFRDPDRRAAADTGDDAVLSPADGRVLVAGRAAAGGGAAGRVAADQHLSLADGRARQPRAGLRPRHARQLHARTVSARLPSRRRDRQRAQ